MIRYFTNNFSVTNLHKNPSIKSEIVTQMIYGESFSIIKKNKKWIKIKIKEDNYKGFVKNKKFSSFIKPTHKVCKLKTKVYNFYNKKKFADELSFNSKIKVLSEKNGYLRFDKGWVKKRDVKRMDYKDKDVFKNIKIFRNIRYKWGGKSFKGIDCSGLIQVFLNFNNRFCPRDTKDQLNYFKGNIDLKKIKKNDIIYWKGHVAVALSGKQLIHAYGPMKKTVIMNIKNTLKRIKETANLSLKKIKRVK